MKLKIENIKQAKQACFNAVALGLAHQGWLSDGFVWHDRWHGRLGADERGPSVAFFSSMGWLVREGEHEKVFINRRTEAGMVSWSYLSVIENSHPELSRWYSKYVHGLNGTQSNSFIGFMHELNKVYMECMDVPKLLHMAMLAMCKSHGLKWPTNASAPPPPPPVKHAPPVDSDVEPSGILVRRDE